MAKRTIQDLLIATCWGLMVLAASNTINNAVNVHTRDSGLTPAHHMFRTEGVDIQDAIAIGWGKPVIFSRKST